MGEASIGADEIAAYKEAVGRTIEQGELLDRHVAARLAATFDTKIPDRVLPRMWHYGLFIPSIGTDALDIDGHPRRGDFLPAVRLPRRMFAGASLKFVAPLVFGEEVVRTSRIASVDHRRGKTGDLVLVRVAMTLRQRGALCVEEEQTIIYRAGATERLPPVHVVPRAALGNGEVFKMWRPSPVELFRFSAATFNSHRIHYDRPYATDIELYPDLVVHGPLIAMRLLQFAELTSRADISAFSFKARAPTFVDLEVRLVTNHYGDASTVRAERADGTMVMLATAQLG